MKHSETTAEITKALIKVQLELKPIEKDSINPHFKNKYASLDSITGYVLPILAKHGIALAQGGHEAAGGVGITTTLFHSSGEWISSEYVLPLEKSTAQSAGSAISYGRRYGLASILALSMADDDGEAALPIARLQDEYTQTGSGKTAKAGDLTVVCPKCSSDMWDNRLTKKNPKAPDYKCRDPKCEGVIWPPKGGPQNQTDESTRQLRASLVPPPSIDLDDPYRDDLPF